MFHYDADGHHEPTLLKGDDKYHGNPGVHALESNYGKPILLGFKPANPGSPNSPGHYFIINTLCGSNSIKCHICKKHFTHQQK